MPTTMQTKAIHALRRKAGLTDEDYRALLAKHGVASSKDLGKEAANALVVELKTLAGQQPGTAAANAAWRERAATVSGRFAPILRALWLAGYNLGVVANKDDAALIAFVKRQTGLPHTQFLVEPHQAKRAIEALKDWLAREGGVVWPQGREDFNGLARKEAVTAAIAARLVAIGAFKPLAAHIPAWPGDIEAYGYSRGLPARFNDYRPEHWDRLAGYLGTRLRASLAKKRKAEEAKQRKDAA